MRSKILILPIAWLAAPAAAAAAAPVQVPQQIVDPQMADRLTGMMQAMSKAFLALPIGEIQAAAEGREVSSADRGKTIGSETGLDQRALDRKIAEAKPAMEAGMKAMADALPVIAKSVGDARDAIERAAANMPRPDYPNR